MLSGLISYSYWAKDPSIAYKTISAISETATQKPAFRDAIRLRRCMIPANGILDQKVGPREEQPYNFGMIDGSLFAQICQNLVNVCIGIWTFASQDMSSAGVFNITMVLGVTHFDQSLSHHRFRPRPHRGRG